jgi:hypothetical protein
MVLPSALIIQYFLPPQDVFQPSIRAAPDWPEGELIDVFEPELVPLGDVPVFAVADDEEAKEEEEKEKEENEKDKRAKEADDQGTTEVDDDASAVADYAGPEEVVATEEEEATENHEKAAKEDEEKKGKTRSSGSAKPRDLRLAKQKVADLEWWATGVHQVVIWVGTARSGKGTKGKGN